MSGVRKRASLLVLVGVLLAGCRGALPAPQPPAAPTATPTVGEVALPTRPPATIEPTLGPSPTPSVPPASGPGESYTSPLYNYSVVVPRGWNIGPGAGKIGAVTADVFTGPTVDGLTTNVNIIAQNLPAGVTDTPSFFRANMAGLLSAGTRVSVVGSVTVDQGRATLVRYPMRVPNGDQTYVVHQTVFVMGNRGWVITLSTAERAVEPGLADFRQMLASFQAR